jgi:hypothetical protein
MPTEAKINESYLVDKDSSVYFETNPSNLATPMNAINYQLKWEAGVSGKVTWEASIYEGLWEDLEACEPVELVITGDELIKHCIIVLPNAWLTMGYLRFIWEPDASGSSGNISAAIRVVPI